MKSSIKIKKYHIITVLLALSFWGCHQGKSGTLIWKLSELQKNLPKGFEIIGDPQPVSSSVGVAVHFNGRDDAFLCDENPLEGLRQFTIEVIMNPDANGPFAQRFFHLGSPRGRRVLMEIRNEGDKWYLDAFLNSTTHLTLADSTKTHATGKWYDVAFVVNNGKMDTYVNGHHELSGQVEFSPFKPGKASLGVRMNREYWFKGSIYEVRIVPKALKPQNFLKLDRMQDGSE